MGKLINRRKNNKIGKNSNYKVLDNRIYNILLGIMILYGLFLNYVLCKYGLSFVILINPLIVLICGFLIEILGIITSILSKKASISFIGYNLLIIPSGLMLSLLLQTYGGVDALIVRQAFLYTMIISCIMIILGIIYPKFFQKIYGILFIATIGILLAEAIAIICNIDNVLISWVSAIIYSLYIGYDIGMSQKYKKTIDNAINGAIDLYLDIYIIFLDILEIFSNIEKK